MIRAKHRYGRRSPYGSQGKLLSLLTASFMALWLLINPAIISGLSLGWRLPIWLLGVWAVGAGFFHGMGLVRRGWMQSLLGAPQCWVLLLFFYVIVLIRS
ncbi:cyd operon YbgE family protein [Halomonas sp. M20]|uniref:cyd operon YbgE family protein n=1 Tax=Halomonas sp. M20 TaxID=2763264 RepID=UPI001D0A6CB6|nr:cyd operon YbgE family protein [Halomonas sp. M20]